MRTLMQGELCPESPAIGAIAGSREADAFKLPGIASPSDPLAALMSHDVGRMRFAPQRVERPAAQGRYAFPGWAGLGSPGCNRSPAVPEAAVRVRSRAAGISLDSGRAAA